MKTAASITRIGVVSPGGIGGLLLAASLLLQAVAPREAVAQAAAYSTEESESGVEGLPGGTVDVAPLLIPGMAGSSIGAAHSGNRVSGGQSAMLRYDQHREITPPEYATIRLGPLYSNIGIAQSVGYRYTRLSGAGIDYLESSRRGDVIKGGSEFPLVSSLTLNNYMIITRKMDLEANISINYYHYPMKTQEDELQINLSDEGIFATFSTQFTPSRNSRLLVFDDILYRTDYVDTRGLSDRYGGREYEFLQNTAGLDWDWKPGALDSFSASASRQDTIPISKEFDAQKGIRYSEVASYRRSLTPFAAAGLLGTASQAYYDDPDRPDVFLNGISAFTGIRIAPPLTGDASLGYQVSTSTGGLLAEDVTSGGVTASLGLDHEISEKSRQRLYWQRLMSEAFVGGVDMSDTLGYNLSWNGGLLPGSLSTTYTIYDPQDEDRNGYADWATTLGVRHQLTRLLNLSLVASYSMRMNDTPVTADTLASETLDSDVIDSETLASEISGTDGADTLPDLGSDYETLTLTISTGFQMTKKTKLYAYASRADRTSADPDLAYTRDTVGVTLTWSHQF